MIKVIVFMKSSLEGYVSRAIDWFGVYFLDGISNRKTQLFRIFVRLGVIQFLRSIPINTDQYRSSKTTTSANTLNSNRQARSNFHP